MPFIGFFVLAVAVLFSSNLPLKNLQAQVTEGGSASESSGSSGDGGSSGGESSSSSGESSSSSDTESSDTPDSSAESPETSEPDTESTDQSTEENEAESGDVQTEEGAVAEDGEINPEENSGSNEIPEGEEEIGENGEDNPPSDSEEDGGTENPSETPTEEGITQEDILNELVEEGVVEEDLITDAQEEKPLLEGRLLTESASTIESSEQAKIKLAEVNLEGKELGDSLTTDEALLALLSLTTTEKDLEKIVLKTVLQDNSQVLAEDLLADSKTSERIEQSTEAGLFEGYEERVGEAISDAKFQEDVSLNLEGDPDVEPVLEQIVTSEIKEDILQKVVESKIQNTELTAEEATKEVIQNDYNQIVLKEVVTEKLLRKESAQNILLEALNNPEGEAVRKGENLIKVSIAGPSGPIELSQENIRFEAGSVVLVIDPLREFVPGLHQAEVELFNPITGVTEVIQQDFLWGVLAVNTNKDVYKAGDEGRIEMGVLDQKGRPVCDATVLLDIIYPNGSKVRPTIENTGNCEVLDPTNIEPDYKSIFKFDQIGEYTLKVQATLPDGKTHFSTSKVTVEEQPAYIIERQAATRLYPVGSAPMTIKVHFFRNFNGTITDQLPSSFEISEVGEGGSVAQEGNEKQVNWSIQASAGEVKTLNYLYDAPDISPEFYTVGPLKSSGDLLEKRLWQIANDEPFIDADSTTNLRVHWKFNEGTGTSTTDSSANGLNGTMTNMEAIDWTTNRPTLANENPFALDFDGVNEYVNLNDPASGVLDFADTADFTITGWFYRDTATTDDTIVAKKNDQTTGLGYMVFIDDSFDTVVLQIADGTDQYSLIGSTAFTTPGWNHFAAVWDQNDVNATEIYINGVDDNAIDVGTIANIGSLANTLAFRVGAESDAGNPFDGKLDDIRVYNKVLSQSEISILSGGNKPGGNTGLNLWLRADLGVTTSGNDVTTWMDQSGGGYSFTQGTVANQPDKINSTANFNPVINFDGVNDVLTSSGYNQDPMNVFAVVRNTDTGNNERTFFGIGTPSAGVAHFMAQKANSALGQSVLSFYQVSNVVLAATANMDNEFFLHGGLLDNMRDATGILSINGKNMATDPGVGLPATMGSTSIGAGYTSGTTLSQYLQGDVAEILVYGSNQTGTNRQKIESYLALKYGITLDQTASGGGTSYLNSDGTTVWAADTTDTYEHDIAGIIQDDASRLDQTKSKSVNSDEILTVGDATSQGNMDSMTWANNNGAATWTTTGAPGGYKILSRIWQTKESDGDIGTVDLEFDVADPDFDVPVIQGGTGYYFVFDTDDDGLLSDQIPTLMVDNGTTGDDVASDNKWTRQAAFAVDAGGGGATREFTIATLVDPPPVVTDANISVNLGTGTGNAFKVGDQVIVSWFNNLDGNTGLTGITADLSGWGGSATAPMTDTSACSGTTGDNIYEACYTLLTGSIDAINVNASVTATNLGGSTTTADTSNRIVDNQPPTVTTANISVTGATGTGGAFKNGNAPVGRWNNSAGGNNNPDISSVSFDLSNFKAGDTNRTGGNSSNIWTASLSGVMDAQADANNNTTVTVTDDAGNQTTTAGTNNYSTDTYLPSITGITSVAGDTTPPYYDPTNNSNTPIIFTSTDTGTGVASCRFNPTNVAYSSMGFSCASTTNCTPFIAGEGAKTVYLSCIDGVGNAVSSNTQVDYIVDQNGPTGTSITPASTRIIDNTNPSFVVNDGTDAGTGIDTTTRLLERREATYANNSCGTFGGYSTVTYAGTYPNISDNTVSGSKCYEYRWSVSDFAAHTSTATTATIERVPLTTLVITAGNNQSYGNATNNPIGHTLATPLQVRATDGGTNSAKVDEVTVDFEITAIPGAPNATGQNLSATSDNTDANGYTEVSLTLGDRAGVYEVEASSDDAVISNTVTFTATAGEYFNLTMTENSVDIPLDPTSNPLDSVPIVMAVITNAASYEVALTPDQWLTSGIHQILNWASPLGFGWSLNAGAVTAFLENVGNPTVTPVYTCTGDTCQTTQNINIGLHVGIDFSHAAGTYTSDVEFSGQNIDY